MSTWLEELAGSLLSNPVIEDWALREDVREGTGA